jgi:hypothetical protein
MIGQLVGPIANLAGGWLQGKADAQAAAANLKLVEAEAKATIMKSAATSEAEWERLMAQGTQNSWKDEYLVLLFSIPLILSFLPFEWAKQAVTDGFAALETMPQWYSYTLGVIVASSFAVRSATKFFGGKK